MKYSFYSKKLGREITFSRPGSYYVYINLNGRPGTLGNQICDGGEMSGSTISFSSDNYGKFERMCRNWWKNYLRKH